MGFSEMLWGAEKLVPAEYWCPYGTVFKLGCLHTAKYEHSKTILVTALIHVNFNLKAVLLHTLYASGSQTPARQACQSGPRDSAVYLSF